MCSNFKTHSNYRPLKISGSAAWKWAHYSWLPRIFKYLGLWVGLDPILGKAFLLWVALSGTGEHGISPGVFRFHLGQFPHLRLLWHLWQQTDHQWVPRPQSSGLPPSCFVTPGHSELPVPRYRVKRAPLSYPIQREEKTKTDVKGALSSLVGRRFSCNFHYERLSHPKPQYPCL